MPRRVQDGGGKAARAGARKSVPDAGGGLSQARDLDRAYFRRNPHARSYTRPYIEGECLVLAPGAPRPRFVAVAFVSAHMTTKVTAFGRADLLHAKREAEALAAAWRGAAARGASA